MTQDKPLLYDQSMFDGFNFKTSLTDNGEYPLFCEQAIHDDSLFRSFRQNPTYTFALEHDSEQQGIEYLDIAKQLPAFADYIEAFKKNDAVGDPVLFEYEQIGEISPTTIRYIKILRDLEREFGNLNHLDICEIGVGYGGLCRIINTYFSGIKSYSLVDLQPVLGLAEKYLLHFQVPTTLLYKTAEKLTLEEHYNLVISNYAFTELKRDVQDIYLEKIISKSERGYITYGQIDLPDFNCYSVEELLGKVPNGKILDEINMTNRGDCILVWSKN